MSTGAPLSVRRAGDTDLPGVWACDETARVDRGRAAALESWVRRGECLVAERRGEIAGFVVLEHGFFGNGFIPLISVRGTHRRQGVALRLLRVAERECRTPKLFASTNASNAPARRLLERAGFLPSGAIENLDADDPELVFFKHRAVEYDRIGVRYAERRKPDPRIAAQIDGALGPCRRVVNVGAGTGSYEPADRFVVAAEPSPRMIEQRAPGAAPAIRASAERLPLKDRSFDAALAILTIHHWLDRARGLAELRRVARERVVVLIWDSDHPGFWLVQAYFPEIVEIDRATFPTLREIENALGPIESHVVPVPADCSDGFLGAYWRRPQEYLDARTRAAISIFSRFDPAAGLARLARDLEDGSWHARYGTLTTMSELDVGYRLVVARYA
jgi:SAM-dependent methyltransferase